MSGSGEKTRRAKATIAVHVYEPTAYEEPAQGPVLSRIHVEETFSGDIEGEGVVEFLQSASAGGSASFVGIERITGTLAGLRGTGGFRANLGEGAETFLDYWFEAAGVAAPGAPETE
jgi:hypothetical protein